MTTLTYMNSLRFRHADLETQIANEIKRPAPNVNYLKVLKKQKLRLKEVMSDLKTA